MVRMRQGRRFWDDRKWWERYAIYCLFSSSRGHGHVIVSTVDNAKYPGLENWYRYQRANYRLLTQEKRDALENAGMIWDRSKHEWERQLILFDKYFEEYPDYFAGDTQKYVAYGTLDDGYESDHEKVRLGVNINDLRARIAFQCDQIPKYSKLRKEPDVKKRNKHLQNKGGCFFDLCESQINDLIRVNFTMKCGVRGSGTCVPLHEYLVGKNIDYQYEVPNNYK